MAKTKWYESSPGNTSSSRIMSMMWLWLSLPFSFMLINAFVTVCTTEGLFTWEKAATMITLFALNNLAWIAPKALKTIAEENGILSKLLAERN